jgi:UDP-N-acetylmuramoylalanine-D-glutamate ligase
LSDFLAAIRSLNKKDNLIGRLAAVLHFWIIENLCYTCELNLTALNFCEQIVARITLGEMLKNVLVPDKQRVLIYETAHVLQHRLQVIFALEDLHFVN